MGYEIAVSDELIAEALNALLADRRDIILLSYFLDMNDREIAQRLNLVQRTVNYRRTSALQELKKYMEGNANEQNTEQQKQQYPPAPVSPVQRYGNITRVSRGNGNLPSGRHSKKHLSRKRNNPT